MGLIKNKKGYSLLELLIVLGIVSALIAAAFLIYPKVRAHQQVEEETKNLTAIQAGMKSLYAGRIKLDSLSTALFAQSGNAPQQMIIDDGQALQNVWKGSVQLGYDGNHGKYHVEYDNVPSDVCSKFVAAVQGDFVKVSIYAATSGDSKDMETGTAFDVAKTTEACGSDTTATILFYSEI